MNLLTALLTEKYAKEEWDRKMRERYLFYKYSKEIYEAFVKGLQFYQDMQNGFIRSTAGSGLSFSPILMGTTRMGMSARHSSLLGNTEGRIVFVGRGESETGKN